jgi:hypothetical protein
MLIGLLGKKRAGKDTVADFLNLKYGFIKLVLAQPLKDICKILFNFTDDQLYGELKEINDPHWGTSPRIVMQYLGTDIFRNQIKEILPNIGNNFWINSLIPKYLKMKNNNNNCIAVISDIRFQNEIDKIHENGGIIIKIERPSNNIFDDHESEKNIDLLNYDHLIINDKNIPDLYQKVDDLIKDIL